MLMLRSSALTAARTNILLLLFSSIKSFLLPIKSSQVCVCVCACACTCPVLSDQIYPISTLLHLSLPTLRLRFDILTFPARPTGKTDRRLFFFCHPSAPTPPHYEL